MTPASELSALRQAVERSSLELLEALNARALQTQAIASAKARLALPVRDALRESELMERLVEANAGPLPDEVVRALFRQVIDVCVSLMEGRPRHGLLIGSGGGPRVSIEVRGHTLGGDRPVYLAGPCAVESEPQLDAVACSLAALGVGFLRGGAFKPRTSPYAFQGLGVAGLRLLREVADRYGMAVITEATSPANVEEVARWADVIQLGARNMYNYELLRAAGETGLPVLLKRSFSATLEEWLHAAEYVALAGSERIALCERGIRAFARETRSTLDLSAVPLARSASRLPVVVDVSHAAGRRDVLAPLSRAAFAAGAHAVMLEIHPDPDAAWSDADQQLTPSAFAVLQREVALGLARAAAALAPRPFTAPDLAGPIWQNPSHGG